MSSRAAANVYLIIAIAKEAGLLITT